MATTATLPAAGARNSAGAIRFDHVGKRFEQFEAVRDLNLEIRDGELLVLLGPSGCGKTTTLNMLAGLEQPTSGKLYFGSQAMNNVPPEERDIAMVFQSIALYPHLNVRDNIGFALRTRGSSRQEINARIDDVVHILDINQLLDRRIHQLSGGQRQRVAIAKALVRRPRLFLLDEPFSSLDAALRRQMRSELARIHREVETTMVFVTHDQEEAMAIADRIAVMNAGQIEHLGTPLEVYNNPRNLWVAQFIGSHPINVIEARRDGNAAALLGNGGWRKAFPESFPVHGDFLIGVRPEHLAVTPGAQGGDGTLLAEIYTRQILGTDILYELKTGDQILRAVTPTSQVYEVGQPVAIGLNWSDAFLFDKETGAALQQAN
jgi:ABC-type sugar transport system ATPase subunit